MKAVFADTFYFLALLNQRDPAHRQAVTFSRTPEMTIVTTEFVLLELADAFSKPATRPEAIAVWSLVETDPAFRLVRASTELLQRGPQLYRERRDKEWELTDCIPFVVMRDQGSVGSADRRSAFRAGGLQGIAEIIAAHALVRRGRISESYCPP
jgi:hypothetical protein